MRDTSRESMCISKIKKMLAIALSVSMLLSACGSTSTENTAEDQPVEQTMEEPNDTSSIDQEQAENATEKRSKTLQLQMKQLKCIFLEYSLCN